MATVDEIVASCKTVLQHEYGAKFKGMVLYGSVARGQPETGSDIDLQVLLCPSFDYFRELRRIVELLYALQLDTDRLISAKPVAQDDFEKGRLQFYRNAKREGILV